MMMDINNAESNPLQLENCYFDAMHKRVQGFKSLGLWTFHPTMKKILCYASMEIHSENTCDIAVLQFFQRDSSKGEKKDINSIRDASYVMRGDTTITQ